MNITSRRNPLCVHMKRLGSSREYRNEHGEFLCDGLKLLNEAMLGGVEIKTVLTASQIPFPLPVETRVFQCDSGVISSVSPLKASQGPLFACTIKKSSRPAIAEGTHVLLDGLQDPGNVGTIIRSAYAFGIKSVILGDGCADMYNPKTIRASMGAIFRQDIFAMDNREILMQKERGCRIVGAATGKGLKDISGVALSNSVIAIGSEGKGLSKEILSICDELAMIPISPECESLNAAIAAAIVMWEAARRTHTHIISI